MDFSKEFWEISIFLIIYTGFFLRVIALNVAMIFALTGTFIFLTFIIILPYNFRIKFLKWLDSKSNNIYFGDIAFNTMVFIVKLQKDIMNLIPSIIPRNIFIYPIEKRIFDLYASRYDAFLKGSMHGLLSQNIPDNATQKIQEGLIKRFFSKLLYVKYLAYPLAVFLILIISSLPTFFFVILIFLLFSNYTN